MMKMVNIADYEALAREKLSPMAWAYFAGGAEDEVSLQQNHEAFRRIKLRPRHLVDVRTRDLSTQVMGQKIAMPVILAPTTLQRLAHPDAELAAARAAAAAGTIYIAGSGNHHSVAEVAACNQNVWFQAYYYNDRKVQERLIRRAEAAGCTALVVTIDAHPARRVERSMREPLIWPVDIELRNLVGVGLPDHLIRPGDSGLREFLANIKFLPVTWDDVAWTRATTKLPMIIKGVMTAEDAVIAVEHGADGIVVSNHGARQIDGTLATIEMLPEVVDAVGGKTEILLDGGVRRGTDIFKALALGAKAVLIGRPFLWGLAVDGEAGVREVLTILREELDCALDQTGQPDVKRISQDAVWVES
ncbi:MAG: alpha-hydroxy-acid oxidizing protein [Chloroflexi bacterium]|nr:alpha-hydroxy-acid oxidizing protein [Chloroflexota bacterium]